MLLAAAVQPPLLLLPLPSPGGEPGGRRQALDAFRRRGEKRGRKQEGSRMKGGEVGEE